MREISDRRPPDDPRAKPPSDAALAETNGGCT
jgi:hypothetical protein